MFVCLFFKSVNGEFVSCEKIFTDRYKNVCHDSEFMVTLNIDNQIVITGWLFKELFCCFHDYLGGLRSLGGYFRVAAQCSDTLT